VESLYKPSLAAIGVDFHHNNERMPFSCRLELQILSSLKPDLVMLRPVRCRGLPQQRASQRRGLSASCARRTGWRASLILLPNVLPSLFACLGIGFASPQKPLNSTRMWR